MVDYCQVAASWVAQFTNAVASDDIQALAECFLPDGWLRDVLIFSSDNRALRGRNAISDFLAADKALRRAGVTNVVLDGVHRGMSPTLVPLSDKVSEIQFGITFETPIAWGRGFVQLQPEGEQLEWRALVVFTMMDNLKGHEELGLDLHLYHAKTWEQVIAEEHALVESQPDVLIIGAGHNGLMTAARMKQMGIRALVVDRNSAVGDNWRNRYPTLSLHTTRKQNSFLYQPFPKNWPRYTPRVKIADWSSQYVENLDLVVWTQSTILPAPIYSTTEKHWTVVVDRNGAQVTIYPSHIVIATGLQSRPYIPAIPGQEVFAGKTLHTSVFCGGAPYVGQHVVIVGTGNSAGDIAIDLHSHGAASITLIQRGATCVVSAKSVGGDLDRIWPDDGDIDECDFKAAATPYGLLRQVLSSHEAEMWERDKDLHAVMRAAGMKLTMGRDGSGFYGILLDRAGGYWIDVGCSNLIQVGKVKVKGSSIERFVPEGVMLADGTILSADCIIYATGFHDGREDLKAVFGEEAINRTKAIWGQDSEGELNGTYRPSGHPGLWYAAGDFGHARFMSKQLALEIKASMLSLMTQ